MRRPGVALIVASVPLAGCAEFHKHNVDLVTKAMDKLRQETLAEMERVRPVATTMHMQSCKAAAESPHSLSGEQFQLTGPLQPNLRMSCLWRAGSIFGTLDPNVSTLAFMAPAKRRSGLPLSAGIDRNGFGCIMQLKDGAITVIRAVPPDQVNAGELCAHI